MMDTAGDEVLLRLPLIDCAGDEGRRDGLSKVVYAMTSLLHVHNMAQFSICVKSVVICHRVNSTVLNQYLLRGRFSDRPRLLRRNSRCPGICGPLSETIRQVLLPSRLGQAL